MSGNRSVVLVVGLGSTRRLLLATALQRQGFEAIEAQDGFEALQILIDKDVDLLIADDEMRDLTGHELIGIVRRHRRMLQCLLISDLGRQGVAASNIVSTTSFCFLA